MQMLLVKMINSIGFKLLFFSGIDGSINCSEAHLADLLFSNFLRSFSGMIVKHVVIVAYPFLS